MKQPKIVLGLIMALALLLRLAFLGSIPAGFSPDEASQAYSAYSLLKTGHDEWGLSWPISSFRSFLDYKAPLQTYLMIPSIAVFGLNEFAARLPSALVGALAVFAVYLLTKKLFAGSDPNLPLMAALFLAISPWHLQFSRTALEVNLASFLFPLGLFYFLNGLERPKSFLKATICWGLCFYTYHAAKVFLPLFILVLIFQYRQNLSRSLKYLVGPLLLGFIILSPLLWGTFFGQAGKRGGDLLITTLSKDQQISLDHETFYSKLNQISPKLPRFFHNSIVFSLSKFAENYVSYYTLGFWFTEGGREITYSVIPGRGLLYFWLLPLIIWAVFDLFRNPKNRPLLMILIPWLLLAALPAALTKEGYRPNRAGSFAGLWEILAAYGAVGLSHLEFKYKKVLSFSFFFFSLILTLFYLEDYAFGSRVNYPTAISYGWREALSFVQTIEPHYQKIIIQRGSQSQSFVAFYTKYDPVLFQQASAEWNQAIMKAGDLKYLDQLGSYRLGKYSFEDLNWPEDINDHTLYLSQPSALLPPERHTLHRVEVPNGVIFEIFDFKK